MLFWFRRGHILICHKSHPFYISSHVSHPMQLRMVVDGTAQRYTFFYLLKKKWKRGKRERDELKLTSSIQDYINQTRYSPCEWAHINKTFGVMFTLKKEKPSTHSKRQQYSNSIKGQKHFKASIMITVMEKVLKKSMMRLVLKKRTKRHGHKKFGYSNKHFFCWNSALENLWWIN